MRSFKKAFAAGLMALPLMFTAHTAAADYPEKPIRWLVPYPAGGGSDFLARTIGEVLGKEVGQPVVIENKPGGNTSIAANDVVRSNADGYSLLSADNGTLVFNPALYENLSYKPLEQLAPVTLMGVFPMILVTSPESGLNSVQDVIDRAKASDSSMDFASAGAGSPHHLAMELFNAELGLDMIHIPYRGAAPSLTDVAGGTVPVMMTDLAAGYGFLKGNKLKPLAVAHTERLAQLPDVPTFAELGYPNIVAAAQVGLVTTAGTPKETIDALNKHVVGVLNQPAVHNKLVDFGIQPVGNSPDEFAAMLQSETQRWHKLIKDLGISLE